MNLIYNINFDVAGIIILLLVMIIFKAQYTLAFKSNKIFVAVLWMSMVTCIIDIVTVFTITYAATVPNWVNILTNSLYFFSAFSCTYLGSVYIFESIHFYTKFHKFYVNIIAAVYLLLLIINSFTGLIFYFEDGQYKQGPFFILNYISSLLIIIDVGIVFILRRKFLTPTKLLLNSSFIIIPIIFICIQFFFPYYLLTCFCMVLITIVMIFTLDTPDFYELEYLRKNLETEVAQQTKQIIDREKQIENMSVEMVQALAQAIDEKDEYTKGHSVRVAQYSVAIGKEIGLSEEKIKFLNIAALLHDIGKIGVPDIVLQKPSKLSDEEFKIIQQHTLNGGKILHNVTSLPYAEEVALHHHERFDGTGYPDQMKGSDIPYFARIVSIADAYDAMSTKRVYRDKLDTAEIRKRLLDNRGTQFDPQLLDIFLNLFETNRL